jgi:hypothetical protein
MTFVSVRPALGEGSFISAPSRADMVHDPNRNVLYRLLPAYQVVLEKTGLRPGRHSVSIEVSDQRNPDASGYNIDVDAFDVIP